MARNKMKSVAIDAHVFDAIYELLTSSRLLGGSYNSVSDFVRSCVKEKMTQQNCYPRDPDESRDQQSKWY